MATRYDELVRRVFVGFSRTDGEALLAVKQAINDAHTALAQVQDFDDLVVWDKTSAATVDGQARYHLTSDLALTRPKDIYSIILHDDSNSRKLTYVPPRELDKLLPYPESIGEQRPNWYTRFGNYLEFIAIPDAAYTLYIRHSQWPVALSNDSDETPFSNLDSTIVFLSKDIANAYLHGEYFDFATKALEYLKISVRDEKVQPDQDLIARPFEATGVGAMGEYWKLPFVKQTP